MSEYSELVKRFDTIRDYMRDFYVYGFKSRETLGRKSLRSYDNEKRRIESYLGEYMSFRQEPGGKNIFLSVDSAEIPENPFYRAFQAKSFTKNDITLHFYLLDLLQNGEMMTAAELAEKISKEYLPAFAAPEELDVSTIRNKLTEYHAMGILRTKKQGKRLLYFRETRAISVEPLREALQFFAACSPLGVVGSYLLARCSDTRLPMGFRHHYIVHALDSEIIARLLEAIHGQKSVWLENSGRGGRAAAPVLVVPLRMLCNVQSGRRYLAAYCSALGAISLFRLDHIRSVKIAGECPEFYLHWQRLYWLLSRMWGASLGQRRQTERLEMLLNIPPREMFVADRIAREGRHGVLTRLDHSLYRYEIDVLDATEMLPWLRTFIGRVVSLKCSNHAVEKVFYDDLREMYALYEEETDAVQ